MTWTDPLATAFETGDVLTESNLSTYVLNNLLSLGHPLEAPTTADNDINTTAAETTLYSVTIPANKLGTNGSAEMFIKGDFLYNNNTADTITIRAKFGGLTVLEPTAFTPSGGLNAVRFPYELTVRIDNRGATNAQLTSLAFTALTGSGANGIGNVLRSPAANLVIGNMQNTAATDTTASQSLLVSVQWSASSANNSWRRRWARTLIGQN